MFSRRLVQHVARVSPSVVRNAACLKQPPAILSSRSITSTSFILPDPSFSATNKSHVSNLPLSKIVATIGPTSEQAEPLKKVVESGMRIMRLNFSHATVEEVELRCTNLAAAQNELSPKGAMQLQDVRAVLLDTKGPEIRTGKLQGDVSGHETVHFEQGQRVTLHTDKQTQEAGSTATDLFIDYPSLHKAVKTGSKVLLDDGAIVLTVEDVESHKDFHGKVYCLADNAGELRSRAGVNLPLADTSDLPALSDKDKGDILYGMQEDKIDFVAASFVQTAAGVRDIRQHIEDCAKQLKWDASHPRPQIISKIETAGALHHFDAILAKSDAIMVARGDLGVEIPIQQVTNAQKEMVAACNAAGKPVIVATQMLESMTKNPRPTRAEVSDVTNAVYDGADAVMLSGETAKGKYPDGAVRMMNEIVRSAECYATSGALGVKPVSSYKGCPDVSAGAALAASAISALDNRPDATAILVLTSSGNLPRLVAANRPRVPILAFCPSAKIGRQLQLCRGVHPVVGLQGVSPAKRAEHAVAEAKQMGFLQTGDEVVIIGMEHEGDLMGRAANLKIATVE